MAGTISVIRKGWEGWGQGGWGRLGRMGLGSWKSWVKGKLRRWEGQAGVENKRRAYLEAGQVGTTALSLAVPIAR